MTGFTSIRDAIMAMKSGGMIVVVDDENRENEGDLVVAGSLVRDEHINFMLKEGRGLVCAPVHSSVADRLALFPMVQDNTERVCTNFTVSVDYRHGTSTGISAHDRAVTARALADEASVPADFLRPGHLFPLRAVEGGVLSRPGHTEAAVDLAVLSDLPPVGIVCEIMNEEGTMARLKDLSVFTRKFALPFMSISDLIAFRQES